MTDITVRRAGRDTLFKAEGSELQRRNSAVLPIRVSSVFTFSVCFLACLWVTFLIPPNMVVEVEEVGCVASGKCP